MYSAISMLVGGEVRIDGGHLLSLNPFCHNAAIFCETRIADSGVLTWVSAGELSGWRPDHSSNSHGYLGAQLAGRIGYGPPGDENRAGRERVVLGHLHRPGVELRFTVDWLRADGIAASSTE